MKGKIIILFLGLVLAVASCSVQDDEPSPQVSKVKLVNKKWYLKGKNGKNWILYQSDGSWSNHAGNNGTWTLSGGNMLSMRDEEDLMHTWEEEILELSDSYLKKKMKGVIIVQEYSTAP